MPKAINTGNPSTLSAALFTDIGLIMLFAVQHTVMARKGFKRWIQNFIPESLTRSIYILLTTVGLGLLIWLWEPIPLTIYDYRGSTAGTVLLSLYYTGWAIGLLSSFELDHFKLFGLKQALYPEREDETELKAPFFYRVVRHPNYLGWILIHWMTPVLTIGHLLLAVGITIYIYVGIMYEERDLIEHFGEQFIRYKKRTPKLNPFFYPFKRNETAMTLIYGGMVAIVIAVAGYGYHFADWVRNEISMMKRDDPTIWREDIQHLDEKNHHLRNDSTAVLFVGSSSFRFWKEMEKELSPIRPINNGFGGAKLTDVLYFKHELIYRYKPRAVVFFLGSNDISGNSNDKTPEEAYGLYEELVLEVHKKMPDAHIYILPVTPTVARWDAWTEIKKLNQIIREHSGNGDWVTLIDVERDFLNEEGQVMWKYFKWDGTHLNRRGYEVWSRAIQKSLITNNNEV